MSKSKLVRRLVAVAIIASGIVVSLTVAEWLQSVLGLPSFLVRKGSHGPHTDLVVLALGVGLLMGYFYLVPKLFRITHDELSRMMRGE
jgi:hypothetical protein